jgi:hypothetical protein
MISEKCFVGAGSSHQRAQPTTEAITEVVSGDQVGPGEVATITVGARDFGLFESFLLLCNSSIGARIFNRNAKYML